MEVSHGSEERLLCNYEHLPQTSPELILGAASNILAKCENALKYTSEYLPCPYSSDVHIIYADGVQIKCYTSNILTGYVILTWNSCGRSLPSRALAASAVISLLMAAKPLI